MSYAFALAFTSSNSNAYNVTLKRFTDNALMRIYDTSTASFERSISGTQLLLGRAGRQKFIWNISAYVSKEQALKIDDMFQAWDADRASGIAAAVGVLDQTGLRSESGSAIFSQPPQFQQVNPYEYIATFVLTEV